jgi:hypothetical protein
LTYMLVASAPPALLVWGVYGVAAAVLLGCYLTSVVEYVEEDGAIRGTVRSLWLGCWYGLLAFVAYLGMVAPWQ